MHKNTNTQVDGKPYTIDTIRKEALSKSQRAYEITAEELLSQNIQSVNYLLHPFLQEIGIACLAGGSDTGKSSLLRQLAVAISLGENDFLDFKLNTKHQSCIYVSTEDLANDTTALLRKQARQYNPKQLSGLRFIFEYHDLLNKLHETLKEQPADAIIIDAFADVYEGDLKDTQKIRSFLHPYQELAQKYECLVIFLHHTGKRTENNEPSKNNLLGGQGFEAKMRLVMELRPDFHNPYHRHLCIVKGNYVSQEYKKDSFLLEFNEQNLCFSNTGARVPFADLVKVIPQAKEVAFDEKIARIEELQKQGKTYQEIADELNIAKSTVSKWKKRSETK